MEAATLPQPTGPALGLDPTRPTQGLCHCGCGTPTPRRYRPGHDAKHHSTLAAALTSGDWRQADRAANLLADLGWTSYADRAALRATPYRTTNGLAAQRLEDVATWQITPSGQHHAHRRCPALTAEARRTGGLNRTTRLAADSWLTFAPNTPALAHRLAHSWDQCTDCSTTHSRDEVAEARELTQTQLLERTTPTPRKTSPTSWTVAPDGEGEPTLRWWNHTTGATGSGTPLPAPALA